MPSKVAKQAIGLNTHTLLQLDDATRPPKYRNGIEKDLLKAGRAGMLRTIEIERDETQELFRT